MRIAHIITRLQTGGAEKILYRHLRAREEKGGDGNNNEADDRSAVISLKDKGPVAEGIEKLGVSVHAMGMHERPLSGFKALYETLAEFEPHLVQTWLYHADLFGGMAARIQDRPVLWSIHNENPKSQRLKRATRIVAQMNAWGSGWIPDRVVSCSRKAAEAHIRFGYPEEKVSVIPNGFEVDQFRPDAQHRASVREELGIPEGAPTIGKVARYHPVKDHENFLRAAVRAQKQVSELHFVLVGTDVVPETPLFNRYQEKLRSGTLHLLGRRDDVPRLMPAFDIATLSSKTEAFPMVLGEAMACGVPCVATNTGDVAYLLGDTGIVVPTEDPEALARGWLQLVEAPEEERRELGRKARRRVQDNFSQDAVMQQYEAVYEALCVG